MSVFRGIYALIFLVSVITGALSVDCLYLTDYNLIFALIALLLALNGALSIDAFKNSKQFNR